MEAVGEKVEKRDKQRLINAFSFIAGQQKTQRGGIVEKENFGVVWKKKIKVFILFTFIMQK